MKFQVSLNPVKLWDETSWNFITKFNWNFGSEIWVFWQLKKNLVFLFKFWKKRKGTTLLLHLKNPSQPTLETLWNFVKYSETLWNFLIKVSMKFHTISFSLKFQNSIARHFRTHLNYRGECFWRCKIQIILFPVKFYEILGYFSNNLRDIFIFFRGNCL